MCEIAEGEAAVSQPLPSAPSALKSVLRRRRPTWFDPQARSSVRPSSSPMPVKAPYSPTGAAATPALRQPSSCSGDKPRSAVARLVPTPAAPSCPRAATPPVRRRHAAAGSAAVVVNLPRLRRVRRSIRNAIKPNEAASNLWRYRPRPRTLTGCSRFLASEGSYEVGGFIYPTPAACRCCYGRTPARAGARAGGGAPDGQIWDGLRSLRKDNTGYDPAALHRCGRAVSPSPPASLFPRLRASATAWLAIADPHKWSPVWLPARARRSRHRLLRADQPTGAGSVLQHILGARDPLAAPHPWYVLVELSDTWRRRGPGGAKQEVGRASRRA